MNTRHSARMAPSSTLRLGAFAANCGLSCWTRCQPSLSRPGGSRHAHIVAREPSVANLPVDDFFGQTTRSAQLAPSSMLSRHSDYCRLNVHSYAHFVHLWLNSSSCRLHASAGALCLGSLAGMMMCHKRMFTGEQPLRRVLAVELAQVQHR